MIIWPTPRPAVKAAVSVLQTAFGAVLVSTAMPRNRPSQFVRVSRVGGGQVNVRSDLARLLIECWGPTDAVVEPMTSLAREALRNAAGTTVATDIFIYAWDNENVVGPYDDPDVPEMTRWQLTGDLYVSTR